ncbi:MAG: hypothetical protein KGH69_01225 [Candidatus Micrarchaeota archaeon]|nr:hypothetical protein [Candidatus Micrarchaeota archaeon]
MSKKNLQEAFRMRARKAKKLSDIWRKSLNEWLDTAEHGKDLNKIKQLGRREFTMRKKANKATEDMYKSWEKLRQSNPDRGS